MQQFRVALTQRPAVGIERQAEHIEGAAFPRRHGFAVLALGWFTRPRPRADGIQRINEIGPAWGVVDPCSRPEGARLRFPAVQRRLGGVYLFRRHSSEIVVTGIEGANMVKAEPAVIARAVKTPGLRAWCAKFALVRAARRLAAPAFRLVAAVESLMSHRVSDGDSCARWEDMTGTVAREIAERLTAAFAPSTLDVINDSDRHRGHAGHDGSDESHFTVVIESAAFAGKSRLERQRMVNRALGDIPGQRVHALAIKAKAPGE